jgi:hypothetical protein
MNLGEFAKIVRLGVKIVGTAVPVVTAAIAVAVVVVAIDSGLYTQGGPSNRPAFFVIRETP